jgi:hypothetical protein
MTIFQALILQWGRRVRDFLFEHNIKSDFAALTALRDELNEVVEQLTSGAAAQDALTKQSRVQTEEIARVRDTLQNARLKPIVLMSRMMALEIEGTNITFAVPNHTIDSERLAAMSEAMVTALKVLGPQFVARGFAPDFCRAAEHHHERAPRRHRSALRPGGAACRHHGSAPARCESGRSARTPDRHPRATGHSNGPGAACVVGECGSTAPVAEIRWSGRRQIGKIVRAAYAAHSER